MFKLYNSESFYFSFLFCQFLFHVFQYCKLQKDNLFELNIVYYEKYLFIDYNMSLKSTLFIFINLKLSFVGICMGASLYPYFSFYLYLQIVSCNLYMTEAFNLVSESLHLIGIYFFNILKTLTFWNYFRFTRKVTRIWNFTQISWFFKHVEFSHSLSPPFSEPLLCDCKFSCCNESCRQSSLTMCLGNEYFKKSQ